MMHLLCWIHRSFEKYFAAKTVVKIKNQTKCMTSP